MEWSPDGKQLAFVSTSRDHKQEWLRVADTATGDVREVMSETAPRFFESGNGKVNWNYLPKSNEILWFSERDNWGKLYLYDLTTGKLKNQITHGDGNVTQVLHVDEKTRTIYFLAVGKERGRDPYFSHFYSIRLGRTKQRLLTPENANHDVNLAPTAAISSILFHADRAANDRRSAAATASCQCRSPSRISRSSTPTAGCHRLRSR